MGLPDEGNFWDKNMWYLNTCNILSILLFHLELGLMYTRRELAKLCNEVSEHIYQGSQRTYVAKKWWQNQRIIYFHLLNYCYPSSWQSSKNKSYSEKKIVWELSFYFILKSEFAEFLTATETPTFYLLSRISRAEIWVVSNNIISFIKF